jgi:hypothetical protein
MFEFNLSIFSLPLFLHWFAIKTIQPGQLETGRRRLSIPGSRAERQRGLLDIQSPFLKPLPKAGFSVDHSGV